MNISIHRPKNSFYYKKSKNNENFGFFLAGIIDGSGHFKSTPRADISFHIKDISVAYFLKSTIKYGIVRKEKNQRNVLFVQRHMKGLEILCNHVHNKLYSFSKIQEYNSTLSFLSYFKKTSRTSFSVKDTPWFSGFFMSDGCFQINIEKEKCTKKKEKSSDSYPEIDCVIEIHQKTCDLLYFIKEGFGGSIKFCALDNTYTYSSVSFTKAFYIIKYFDTFPLMGHKQIQYVLWRKACLKIQNKVHLTNEGFSLIKCVKERIIEIGK